jgi:hypothetical protein
VCLGVRNLNEEFLPEHLIPTAIKNDRWSISVWRAAASQPGAHTRSR